jgi:ubiquinone/menaquinone biosynthesis C-methylase UbiE
MAGNLQAVRERTPDARQTKKREDALDIGTGSGEPALTMAGMVSPAGRVTGIDLSERMIELAKETSRARRLLNVSFKVMDAENLDFRDGSFDLAVSRFGFQIFTNPERAASEAFRALKPGGRSVTVWSTGDKVPALHAIVGPMLEHAAPDETGYLPTPYELGGPGDVLAPSEGGFQ